MIQFDTVVMHYEARLAPHGADAPLLPPTLNPLCLLRRRPPSHKEKTSSLPCLRHRAVISCQGGNLRMTIHGSTTPISALTRFMHRGLYVR